MAAQAERYKARIHPTVKMVLYDKNGVTYNDADLDALSARWKSTFYKYAYELVSERRVPEELTLEEFINKPEIYDGLDEEERRIFHCLLMHEESNIGASFDQCLLKNWPEYEELPGDHCILPDGYVSLLEKMADSVLPHVRLGHRVNRIHYGQ